MYDYSDVPFPEGMIDSSMYFFDQEDIERLYFVGMQDEEELKMEEQISNLGEPYVNDEGKILER